MDYEKMYRDALKRAKAVLEIAANKEEAEGYVSTIFPELKESEDERIRKEIIYHIQHCNDTIDEQTEKRMVAWLEKQDKNIQVMYPTFTFDDILALQCCMETVKKVQEDKELYEQLQSLHNRLHDAYWLGKQDDQKPQGKSAIEAIKEKNVEQKFQIIKNTWYICTCTTCSEDSRIWFKKGIAYLGNDILKYDLGFEPNDYQDYFRLWSIEDAKDGDVLVDSNSKDSIIILYKGIYKERSILAHCGWNGYNLSIKTNGLGYGGLDNTNYSPATKEQRDLLFQKIKEKGYEWDVEKKELKKMVGGLVNIIMKKQETLMTHTFVDMVKLLLMRHFKYSSKQSRTSTLNSSILNT